MRAIVEIVRIFLQRLGHRLSFTDDPHALASLTRNFHFKPSHPALISVGAALGIVRNFRSGDVRWVGTTGDRSPVRPGLDRFPPLLS